MSRPIKRLYLFLTLRMLFPLQYRRFRKLPLQKGKAVFIEANLTQLSGSLRFLYERICADPKMQASVQYLQESGSKLRFIRNALSCLTQCGDAQYIFLCEGSRLISCITPRPETVITQVWHGCGAFKKFGFSTDKDRFGGSREEYQKYNYYGNCDFVTVSSPKVVWAYREAMNLPPEDASIRPIGVSCTDVLFQDAYREAARGKLFRLCPAARGKKVLLYAPTFRGSVKDARAPEQLDIPLLQERIGGNWVLLIRQHPVVRRRPAIPDACREFAFDVSGDTAIEELLCVSDVCVSDYSSLVFEYSLLERPMLFFAFDFAQYRDWRGFYYDYGTLTPGPVVTTTEEIADYVLGLPHSFDREQVREFRRTFMSACDGHATERLLLLVKERAAQKRERGEDP